MILQIDRGNTRLKWRLRKNLSDIAQGAILNEQGYSSLADALSGQPIQNILVVSVLGEEQDRLFTQWAEKKFGVTPRYAKTESVCAGVINGYYFPERLGVDRWLVMLAGFARAKSACVVVDCGSAITVDLLDRKGMHHGGYIAPGIAAMQRALSVSTQGVKVINEAVADELTPARDTASAVSAARTAMIVGLIRQAIWQLSDLDKDLTSPPMLLLTGGDGQSLVKFFDAALFVPDLVFEGLELAFPAD